MIITIHKCDQCGKESGDTPEEREALNLADVAVGVTKYKYSGYSGGRYTLQDDLKRVKAMCKECRAKLGLIDVPKELPPNAPAYPTLEELIREMVREEIANQ
jgi:NifB/MoaA-like Fe-S oxidoreductase